MLSPEQIDTAGDAVAAVYSEIETQMLDRLVETLCEGDALQQKDLTALALLSQTHAKDLQTILDLNKDAINAAVRETVESSLKASDADDIRRLGEGEPMYPQQVTATIQGVAQILARDNIQMLEGAKQAFLTASTKAITQVNTGALTTERALHSAVRQLEREGIPIITYQNSRTGRVTVRNKVDVAVRRHIRTQIAQDGARLTMERLNSLDVALVEVSSHEGARPSHAEWQGRVYSLHGEVRMEDGTKYEDFYTATRYGSVDGLLGANCRHSFGPYRHGAPRAYESDPIHQSGLPNDEVYEMTQTQRYLERQIRECKREVRGAQQVHDAMNTLESRAQLAKAQKGLKSAQSNMREFIEESNAKSKTGKPILTRHPNREWAGDMPKSKTIQTSGRNLNEFLEGKSVKTQLQAKGVSASKASTAIKSELKARGLKPSDFETLKASEQQGMLRNILDRLPANKRATAKANAGKHAATPQRYEQTLQSKGLTSEHATGISKLVAKCKDSAARKSFDDALVDLSFDTITAKPKDAWYSPKTHGLTLNMEATANGFDTRPDKAPYQTFFHEMGHYIDHRLGNYESGIHKSGRYRIQNMSGAAHQAGMAEMARSEIKTMLNEIKQREGCLIAEAKNILNRELRDIPPAARGGIADIVEGATKGTCGWGHGKTYWKDSGDFGLATETFAHFYETTMANPQALETLKHYLPGTYNIFTSIIGGA